MKNHCLKTSLLGVGFLALILLSRSVSAYSLVGDQVEGQLTSGTFQTLLSPFTSPTTVTSPGVEFLGVLQASSLWNGEQYVVMVDVYTDFFTVTVSALNDWGVVSSIGVGGSNTLFDISLSDLNGGEAITSVTYNEALSINVVSGYSDYRYIDWTDTSIDIGFHWAREYTIYHFDINVVPTRSGDLNANGYVDAGDILIGLKIELGTMTASPEQMTQGDVAPLLDGIPNPDGVINAADILVIQRKLLGLIDF